jgi:hypothetical protein
MRFLIRYRLDSEEFFTTDSYTFSAETWADVAREAETISHRNTVLEIVQLNQDDMPIGK